MLQLFYKIFLSTKNYRIFEPNKCYVPVPYRDNISKKIVVIFFQLN